MSWRDCRHSKHIRCLVAAGGDHNWNTASNWSTGAVPGTNDVAIFNGNTDNDVCNVNNPGTGEMAVFMEDGYNAQISVVDGSNFIIQYFSDDSLGTGSSANTLNINFTKTTRFAMYGYTTFQGDTWLGNFNFGPNGQSIACNSDVTLDNWGGLTTTSSTMLMANGAGAIISVGGTLNAPASLSTLQLSIAPLSPPANQTMMIAENNGQLNFGQPLNIGTVVDAGGSNAVIVAASGGTVGFLNYNNGTLTAKMNIPILIQGGSVTIGGGQGSSGFYKAKWEFSKADIDGNSMENQGGTLYLSNNEFSAWDSPYLQSSGTLTDMDSSPVTMYSSSAAFNFTGGFINFYNPGGKYGTLDFAGPVSLKNTTVTMHINGKTGGPTNEDQILEGTKGAAFQLQAGSHLAVINDSSTLNGGLIWNLIVLQAGDTFPTDFASTSLPSGTSEGTLSNLWPLKS